MIQEERFLGERALVLENTFLRVVCLPEFGGKLVSLYEKQIAKEFLFQNPKPTFRRAVTGSVFSDFEACGLDDAFPSVDPENVLFDGRMVAYPDHGEIWSASFQWNTRKKEAISLMYTSTLLPYTYQKTYRLDENALILEYLITNTGSAPFPCIWTLHCLLEYEQGMHLLYPKQTREILNAIPSPRLGERGEVFPFPLGEGAHGDMVDFREIDAAISPCMEKYYVNHQISEGCCGVLYRQSNTILCFEYDKNKLPYVGFWKTLGGYRGDYNCALEPSSGFFDAISRAQHNKACPELVPGEEFSFSIRMNIEQQKDAVKL